MKKNWLSLMMAALMAASLTACGGSGTAETTASEAPAATTAAQEEEGEAGGEAEASGPLSFEGQQLRISTFSFNAELLQKNIYDPFMEATGCELIVEGGKNAERVTKIKETPENYDVVVIGDAFIVDLIVQLRRAI